MGTFHVELKKTVDDSYEIEVGRSLADRLAKDLEHGLAGSLRRFALITDSNVGARAGAGSNMSSRSSRPTSNRA